MFDDGLKMPRGLSAGLRDPPTRILVVDDESSMREINARMLTDEGYHVDVAENGAVAWDILRQNAYSLVITDNSMPEITGVELVLKVRDAGMKLPILMATGTTPKEEFVRNSRLQPLTILLKPYSKVDLLRTVKEVLG